MTAAPSVKNSDIFRYHQMFSQALKTTAENSRVDCSPKVKFDIENLIWGKLMIPPSLATSWMARAFFDENREKPSYYGLMTTKG